MADAGGARRAALVTADRLAGVAIPRFSPDGQRLAFSAVSPAGAAPRRAPACGRATGRVGWAPGRWRRTACRWMSSSSARTAATLRRLTHLRADDPAPAWSPAGDRLAVLTADGIYLVRVDGGEVDVLGRPGGHGTIDWRPAGAGLNGGTSGTREAGGGGGTVDSGVPHSILAATRAQGGPGR